ncbi:P-loop containing nucleoside triphosphate hydrolase protein [Catenaria anguillulae PL171]|uniref:p-loop containing nucleoside triphosphate hydrolase protein n=1 Tax=Catenaria anguillulae PL171 TaxID=765915 RepID=A0A1Y2HFN2_9FUNG|nr:P-loop containing nucleoside triphosphate hydrolase protein [Catenaria anguillulae PL171]
MAPAPATDDKKGLLHPPSAGPSSEAIDLEARHHALRNADKVSPDTRANPLSRLLFSWQTGLIRLGYTRPLEQEDMYQLPDPLTSKFNTQLLTDRWQDQVQAFTVRHGKPPGPMPAQVDSKDKPAQGAAGKQPTEPTPSLLKAFWHAYGWDYVLSGIYAYLGTATQIASPVMLELLLTYLKAEYARRLEPEATRRDSEYIAGYGYLLVVLIFAFQVATTLFNSRYFIVGMQIGMRLRAGLQGMIYAKSLKLSARARASEFTAGRITNMVSTDATKLDFILPYTHNAHLAPITVIVIVTLLVRMLGVAALAGLALMVAFIPVQGKLAQYMTTLRKDTQLVTDKRVKLMNEILQGSRIVKLMSWEAAMTDAVMELRLKELDLVRRMNIWRASINGVAQAIPAMSATLVFAVYYAMGNQLSAPIVFSSLALFNVLRLPLMFIPMTIAFLVDANVSLQRIKSLFLAEELDTQPTLVPLDSTSTAIRISGPAAFEWNPSDNLLQSISLTIPRGSLTAIVGAVGAGKSNLLAGIVGEMRRVQGDVEIAGSIGYCPQQPWVMNASLKDNVLFGLDFDAARYQRAIKLSALERDIEQLQAGEMTEIGERGITLSGGQKARVAFARALYFDPDTLLLDDPIAAVDAHVGKHLFRTIAEGLKGKTRVLVTHALHHVPSCDYIVFMRGGKIVEQGTYAELMAMEGGEFAAQMLSVGGAKKDGASSASASPADSPVIKPADVIEEAGHGMRERKISTQSKKETDRPPSPAKPAANAKLMQAEDRAVGSVDAAVYSAYARAMGSLGTLVVLALVLILTQVFRVGNDLWLTWWTQNRFPIDQGVYVGVYFAWAVAQAGSFVFNGIQFTYAGVRASASLHRAAVYGVMRSPMAFFDTTPMGRILSRLSKDQDAMDNTLVDSVKMFFSTLTTCLSTFVLMIVATPIFALPLVPLLVVYWYIQLFYRSTSRELKRLDSISRSPLYAGFAETLTGLTTIRAYREEARFRDVNQQAIDFNNRPYYMQICAQRWLSIRLESIGSALIFFAGLFGVINIGGTSVELVGLSLSYALSVTSNLNWCVRQAVEVETQMNSVERIWHYAEKLESEAPAITDVSPPTPSWPDKGEIKFSDVTMAYRKELDPVLKKINVTIPAGSKVGIVGRTGSGKSSSIVALFRLVELREGKIEIDGLDIAKLGLHELRSRLAIIPQEPTLFTGSIRSNLDRFNQATDDLLWECLDRAGLKPYVQSLAEKLDAPVEEGGGNLSVGQRQLLCLARSMVRKSNVLVMDEATASCDYETDKQIQRAIRRDFAHATVLTIAHRLNTIIDYDRIAVLSNGELVEFASPHELLQRPDSLFTALVEETGAENAMLLRRLAAEKRLE